MTCPHCGSDDEFRLRRHGLLNQVQAIFGNWPYRCSDCNGRFRARFRSLEDAEAHKIKRDQQAPAQPFSPPIQHASADEGPDMAFRTHPERPLAQIVVQADTHEQLNNILLALNHAVNTYQTNSTRTGAHQHSEAGSRPG